ncbi:hypothetical protein MTO96_003200 [Rhipicephalus appendiculatus]
MGLQENVFWERRRTSEQHSAAVAVDRRIEGGTGSSLGAIDWPATGEMMTPRNAETNGRTGHEVTLDAMGFYGPGIVPQKERSFSARRGGTDAVREW